MEFQQQVGDPGLLKALPLVRPSGLAKLGPLRLPEGLSHGVNPFVFKALPLVWPNGSAKLGPVRLPEGVKLPPVEGASRRSFPHNNGCQRNVGRCAGRLTRSWCHMLRNVGRPVTRKMPGSRASLGPAAHPLISFVSFRLFVRLVRSVGLVSVGLKGVLLRPDAITACRKPDLMVLSSGVQSRDRSLHCRQQQRFNVPFQRHSVRLGVNLMQ